MNPKPMFKLFSLKGMRQIVIPRQVSMLVICVVGLALFALTAYAQEPTNDSGVEVSGLAVAPAAVTDKESASDSAYLAANPELAIASRYAGVTTKWAVYQLSESIFLAANPELITARRYTRAVENEATPSTFLAANPELMVARRYASVLMPE